MQIYIATAVLRRQFHSCFGVVLLMETKQSLHYNDLANKYRDETKKIHKKQSADTCMLSHVCHLPASLHSIDLT